MAQTQTIPEARMTALLHQVVEAHPLSDIPWVIAAFDLPGDAEAFAEAKKTAGSDATYSVREDPEQVALREYLQTLRRPAHVTETLMELDQ